MHRRTQFSFIAAAVAALVLFNSSSFGQDDHLVIKFEPVILTGDRLNTEDGVYTSFESPRVNDSGDMAFGATGVLDSDPENPFSLMLRARADGSTEEVLREPAVLPDGSIYEGNHKWLLNNQGDIGAWVRTDNLFQLVHIADDGALTTAAAIFTTIEPFGVVRSISKHTLTPDGKICLALEFDDVYGLFSLQGGSAPMPIVITGQPVPGLDATINTSQPEFDLSESIFNPLPRIGADGSYIFEARVLPNPPSPPFDYRVLFRQSEGTLLVLLKAGDVDPHSGDRFVDFHNSLPNRLGSVFVKATLESVPGDVKKAIYRVDPDGTILPVVRESQPVPEGKGSFFHLLKPIPAPFGGVVFGALLNGTSNGTADDRGLYLSQRGVMTEVARKGDPAPGIKNATLASIGESTQICEAGFIVLSASSTVAGGGSNSGKWIFDMPSSTLHPLMIRGARLEVTPGNWREVMAASIDSMVATNGLDGHDSITPTGEAAVRIRFEDGTSGIFRATPIRTIKGDADGDQIVGVSDLLAILASWGDCTACNADFDRDGRVGVFDLLTVLGKWSGCVN